MEGLGESASGGIGEELSRLVDQSLPPVCSLTSLALLFGYSPGFIQALRKRPQKYYRTFVINAGSKKRIISSPRVSLKVIQSWLGHHLSRAVAWRSEVHGFVPNRSTATAALQHCGSDWLITLDLRDFFLTTSRVHVEPALIKLGYSALAAELIVDLCFFRGGLPQGSPASPALSNIGFELVDELLSEWCVAQSITYTRYADDLAFSGRGEMPSSLITHVSDLVQRHGWQVAAEKTKIMSGRQAKLLGLMINASSVSLPRAYRNRLRAYKHILDSKGVNAEGYVKLAGHIAYARSIENCEG